ncbi:MAG: hypothetical protein PHF35_02880 [Candidatus Moranbacteria bacterium]|nr:hypothetical protein [Candidatus Moranbacteria bacterium]
MLRKKKPKRRTGLVASPSKFIPDPQKEENVFKTGDLAVIIDKSSSYSGRICRIIRILFSKDCLRYRVAVQGIGGDTKNFTEIDRNMFGRQLEPAPQCIIDYFRRSCCEGK